MKAEGERWKAERSVLACFPLKEEAAPFRKFAARKPGVIILLTGIGRRNAERSLRDSLAAHLPDLVLSCGFAGGLNPNFKLGDVVFEIANVPLAPSLSPQSEEKVSARTGEGLNEEAGKRKTGDESEPTDVGVCDLKDKLLAAGAKSAKCFSADRVAITAVEKQQLRRETGADAVEMESAAVHAVCRERRIPCATVRVISDTASEDLPLDFNQLSKPDQSLDYGKLFLALVKSPGKIGSLMKLQKQTQFAAERLAEVLGQVLQSPK